MERRFQDERFANGVMRERVTMAACALVTTVLGWYESHFTGLYRFPGLVLKMELLRLGFVMPMWCGVFVATFLRGFPRRADAVNAIVITFSCWGHSGITWFTLRANPQIDLVNALTGSTILVLVVAILMLPLRFRTLVVTVVLSVGGPLLLFYTGLRAHPEQIYNLQSSVVCLSLVALLLLLGGWFREAVERRLFREREEARRLAAELSAANAELARLNAEKNEFMAIAAHDLRAPLASVRSCLELMQLGRLAVEPDRGMAVGEMHAQTTRMMTLVSDYLSVYAAENGQLPVRSARVDLGAIVAAARARHANAAAAKGQRIDVHETPVPIWVRADEGLLAQIADNYVTNAIKFSPRGARVQLEVQIALEARLARLAVVDSGPGIPAEDLPRLFRKFGRIGTRPTGGEPSTGLGLAVVKRLAEAMTGRVGCESTPGEGATFWLELPLAE